MLLPPLDASLCCAVGKSAERGNFTIISLGQGQEGPAERVLDKYMAEVRGWATVGWHSGWVLPLGVSRVGPAGKNEVDCMARERCWLLACYLRAAGSCLCNSLLAPDPAPPAQHPS